MAKRKNSPNRQNEITAIKVPLKRTDRRHIYIDGKYAFSISEGIFFQRDLQIGDCLTEEQISLLKADDNRYKIKEAAFRLLGYRLRSVNEIRKRLLQKGWDKEVIGSVLQELIEKGYLNDLEFARLFAMEKISQKFLGPIALKHELFKMGVEKEIIDQIVEESYSKHPPEEVILAYFKKKRIDLNHPMEIKEKNRLAQLLKRKGYHWDHIQSVISTIKTH